MVENKTTPFIIKHPETGENIDIRPFIDFLAFNGLSLPQIAEQADNVIRFINIDCIQEQEDVLTLKNILYFLYNTRDMLSSITVLKGGVK